MALSAESAIFFSIAVDLQPAPLLGGGGYRVQHARHLPALFKVRPHAIARGDAVDQIADLHRLLIVKTDAVPR